MLRPLLLAWVEKWYLSLSYWVNAIGEVVANFVAAPTSQGKIIQAVSAPKRLRLKMIDSTKWTLRERQWCRT
jgi:hypothetical protein